jgi:hypothetical protein
MKYTNSFVLHSKQINLFYRIIFQQYLEAKWLERHPITNKVFIHSLNPMQSQTVQHGACAFHDAQDKEGQHEPEIEKADGRDNANSASKAKGLAESHFPEDDRELLMSEGEGPKT